jgi:hypothetical protein
MQTRKILSAALSLSMLASAFGGLSIDAAAASSGMPTKQVTYTDDFTTYTAADVVTNADTVLTSNVTTLATNPSDGSRWVLAMPLVYENKERAYVDTESDCLRVNGTYGWDWVTAKLIPAEFSAKDVNHVKTQFRIHGKSHGVRFFVSDDNKDYIQFRINGNNFAEPDSEEDKFNYRPSISIYKGASLASDICSVTSDKSDDEIKTDYPGISDITWNALSISAANYQYVNENIYYEAEIWIENGNTLKYEFTEYNLGTAQRWVKGSYTGDEIAGLVENASSPVAVTAASDNTDRPTRLHTVTVDATVAVSPKEHLTKLYSDDFDSYSAETLTAADEETTLQLKDTNGNVVNTDWTYFGTNIGDQPQVTMGGIEASGTNKYLKRNAKWRWPNAGFMLTNGPEELSAENLIEFDFGAGEKDAASTVYARINMTSNSYYELGVAGSVDAIEYHCAPLADENGTPIIITLNKADGSNEKYELPYQYRQVTTTTAADNTVNTVYGDYIIPTASITLTETSTSNADESTTAVTYEFESIAAYANKPYFKMVNNDVTTYVVWGTKALPNSFFDAEWAHASFYTSNSGITYNIKSIDGLTEYISGTCTDTSLVGSGAVFGIGGKGHEGSVRLDNLAI